MGVSRLIAHGAPPRNRAVLRMFEMPLSIDGTVFYGRRSRFIITV